jgi:hypothetical protein
LPAAVAEAATAEAVGSTVEVSAVAVFMVVGSTGEASAVALFTAVPVSTGAVSAVAVSTAVAFVVAVLVGAITDSLMMSSSAASDFRGAGAIRTDITVTTITRTITMDTVDTRTVTMGTATRTAMDTAGTVTTVAAVMAIAMEAEPVTHVAMAADQGMSGVRGVGDNPATGLCRSGTRLRVSSQRASVPCSATGLISEVGSPTAK